MANKIDPRYDPAFQRGYRPKPGEAARTKLRSAQTSQPASPATRKDQTRNEQPRQDPPRKREESPTSPQTPPARVVSPVSEEVVWADDDAELDLVSQVRAETEPAPAVLEYRDDAPSYLDQVDTAPRRNPYFLALWIMGVGFIALGLLLYIMSVATSYTSSNTGGADVGQLVFSQLGWMLASPLITVGLATIVALILIQGLRSRSRRDT